MIAARARQAASIKLRGALIALLSLTLALMGLALGGTQAADAARGSASATPKRIVALSPFAANVLAQMGVKPVGIGQTLGGEQRKAAALRGVRELPLSHPNGPNLEQLATLNPDTVFSSPAWRKGLQAMRELGIKTYMADPTRVGQVGRSVKRIGRIVGRPKVANRVARRMNRQIRQARRNIRKRPTVLLLLGVGRTSYAFLPNSWGGDLLLKSGARLLTKGLSGRGYARISDEVVVQRNPDIIIAVPHANESDIPNITEYLANNPAWRSTRAVRNNRVYISVDNSLLQPGTDVASTIRKVRALYLKNR